MEDRVQRLEYQLKDLEKKLALLLPQTEFTLEGPCDLCHATWLVGERTRETELVYLKTTVEQNPGDDEETEYDHFGERPLPCEANLTKFACQCMSQRVVCFECMHDCVQCDKTFCQDHCNLGRPDVCPGCRTQFLDAVPQP